MVLRLLEEGREIMEATLPTLLTFVKDINQPLIFIQIHLPGFQAPYGAALLIMCVS